MGVNHGSLSVLRAAFGGLAIGIGVSAFAVVAHIAEGPEGLDAMGVTLLEVVAMYLSGGLLGGAVYGVLEPYSRTRTAGAIVGVAALLPIAIVAFAVFPVAGFHRLAGFIITSTILGAGLGAYFWEP